MFYNLRRLSGWVKRHLPTWCIVCGSVYFAKDMLYEHLQWGQNVPICERCHKKMYEPFSKEK